MGLVPARRIAVARNLRPRATGRCHPSRAGEDLLLPAHPQLPAVLHRTGHFAVWNLDAGCRPGLAGARDHRKRHCPWTGVVAAVPSGPALWTARRCDCRPLRQAQGALLHPAGGRVARLDPRHHRRHRCRRVVDGLRTRRMPGLRLRGGQPHPTDLRPRDGGFGESHQRGQSQLGGGECRQGDRPGAGRHTHHRGGVGAVFLHQCRFFHCGLRGPGADGSDQDPSRCPVDSPPRAAARGAALRAVHSRGAGAAADDGGRGDSGIRVPGGAAPPCPVHLRG